MITKEIKDAVMDVLKGRIDRENYGMLSNYRCNPRNHFLLHQKKITMSSTLCVHDEIYQDGKVIGEITYRYAEKKRNGMYKMLKPSIFWNA